ncbi:Rap1a/Tai family immunity protein [Roseococcus microcysteis]|uniref:Rap1a/Tai family immunity protein n=1 Tax=Roseococcus microcysteis TaxID=2771361 RepID=UPI00168B3ADF|nr:Rap1a/Tai family immunity protein [Roseococcus microcysteis]
MALRHIALGVAAAGLLAAAPATAQPRWEGNPPTHVETVRDLARMCDPQRGGVPRLEAIAYCQGYITAAVQFHQLTRRGAPLFCVPGRGPSIAESGVGFAAWARDNRQYANEPALDGMLRWAQVSFPCRGPGPGPRR